MAIHSIAGIAPYLPRVLARAISVVATSVLLFIAAAALPAASSPGGGMLSTAAPLDTASRVAPSEAHAFIRFSPSGFNRWLQFQSRKQRPHCFLDLCNGNEIA